MLWLSLACPLCAQVANNTSLVGTVIDASGNIVTSAKVTAVNEETNEAYTGITNGEGYYAILFIPVGTYDLMLNQPGFAKVTQHGIVVQLNQAVRTDIKLEVGSVVDVRMSGIDGLELQRRIRLVRPQFPERNCAPRLQRG